MLYKQHADVNKFQQECLKTIEEIHQCLCTNLQNMFMSNSVFTVEDILGQQWCTRPDKQSIGHINNLPATEIAFTTCACSMAIFISPTQE